MGKKPILHMVICFFPLTTISLVFAGRHGSPSSWDLSEREGASASGFSPITVSVAPEQPLDWTTLRLQRPYTNAILARLRAITQDAANPHQWESIDILWYSGSEQQAEDRAACRPLLLEIAQQFSHPEQWEAINCLWNSEDDQQAQNRHDVRPALIAIAQSSSHFHRWVAANYLGESNDPSDQALALTLQQNYLPR